jgi:outer membrane protein assembly factor BamB
LQSILHSGVAHAATHVVYGGWVRRFVAAVGVTAIATALALAMGCSEEGTQLPVDASLETRVAPEAARDAPHRPDATDSGRVGDATGGANVLTQHNDNARTGAQLAEELLTTSNVNAAHFGLAFAVPVDDDVYAQPLYVGGVTFSSGVHNALYVATMNDSVYAFDADDGAPLWRQSFLGANAAAIVGPIVLPGHPSCGNITGHLGGLATPAIDLGEGRHGTLFSVAETQDDLGTRHFALHALDLASGAEQPGSPVTLDTLDIQTQGTGGGSDAGRIAVDTNLQFSRAGLLVANRRVYVGFGSLCDLGEFHGWLLAFDEATLALDSVLNTTPQGRFGGIWQGGDGPTADAEGNVYVATGNGDFNANVDGGHDLGQSIVKLSPSLALLDYFSPYDQAATAAKDWDLGSTAPSLLPGTQLLLQIDKTDTLRVLDTQSLGHFDATSDSQIVQEIELGDGMDNPMTGHENFSNAVSWNGVDGPYVYVQGENDPLHQFRLESGQLVLVRDTGDTAIWPGAGLSISANGSRLGSGVVWALGRTPTLLNQARNLYEGVLRAYDADDVSRLLWSSEDRGEDSFGTYMWFTKPTIARGRVYVPTSANHVAVYATH